MKPYEKIYEYHDYSVTVIGRDEDGDGEVDHYTLEIESPEGQEFISIEGETLGECLWHTEQWANAIKSCIRQIED